MTILLECSDQVQLQWEDEVIAAFSTLRDLCEDLGSDSCIPVPFSSSVLTLARQYEVQSSSWSPPTDMQLLCQLTEAANFLGHDQLHEALVQVHRDIIKQHEPEQLRQLYGQPNDLTPAEVTADQELYLALYLLVCQ